MNNGSGKSAIVRLFVDLRVPGGDRLLWVNSELFLSFLLPL